MGYRGGRGIAGTADLPNALGDGAKLKPYERVNGVF